MAIVTDEIAHLAIADETLDQRDVDAPGRFAPAATNDADVAINDRKECLQSFAPLVEELLAMNQHQRVAAPGRNHFCTDDGLAKRRRGGQRAVVMGSMAATAAAWTSCNLPRNVSANGWPL